MLLEKLLPYIKHGGKVLDLGCGKGAKTKKLFQKSGYVTAVDKKITKTKSRGILWICMDIQEYIKVVRKDKCFDVIFMHNVIQFLPKRYIHSTLIPWLRQHVAHGGMVAIRTFYRDPDPPFTHPLASYHTLDELRRYFPGWKVIHQKQFKIDSNDMQNFERRFFVSDLIMRKVKSKK